MKYFMIILSIILGILLGFLIIILILKHYLKKTLGDSYETFKELLPTAVNADKEEYSKQKSISAMTSIYKKYIKKDFPDMNINELFSINEKNLRAIFNAKQNKNINLINEANMELVKSSLSKEINDLIDSNTELSYKNIIFHKQAIKDYIKEHGTATITITSSIGYYYSSNIKDEKTYPDLIRETRYITSYIYIYDEQKFKEKEKSFSINCPKCGAIVTGLGDLKCSYCGSYIKPINLKAWKMSSYKEDI